jgi:hypothetical protein
MSAREQARNAAKADDFDHFGVSNTGHHRMRGADIASDIWEPLLRDLFDMLTRMILTGEDDENWTDDDDDRLNDVYERARQALR